MEEAWLRLMHTWQFPLVTVVMSAVTWLGSLFALLPLALWAAWRSSGSWRGRLFPAAAVMGASGLAYVLKGLVDRPRPDLFPSLIAMPADGSFPSAHAMQSAAFVTAWLLWTGRWRHLGPVMLGVLLTVLVAASRTYLQVHFLSDVIAGIAAGALWAVILHVLPVWKERT